MYGRRRVTLIAGCLTPVCLLLLIIFARGLGLYFIYFIMSMLATSYNPRGSTAYLYGAEILPPKMRLLFNTANFLIDGCVGILATIYFYYFGS